MEVDERGELRHSCTQHVKAATELLRLRREQGLHARQRVADRVVRESQDGGWFALAAAKDERRRIGGRVPSLSVVGRLKSKGSRNKARAR